MDKSDLDEGWLRVAEVFATLAVAAVHQRGDGNVAENTTTQAIRRSRDYEGRAVTALAMAGVKQ